MEKVKAVFVSGKISSNSTGAQTLFEKSRFGVKQKDKFVYMLEEAYYLIEKKKMKLFSIDDKEMDGEIFLKKIAPLDKDFLIRYIAFRDLRNKGYIVKSALKFGADFRIYESGKKIDDSHSKWICFCVSENKNLKWRDFASKNRVAHSVKKNLLICVVDQENDVSYYEVSWKKIV